MLNTYQVNTNDLTADFITNLKRSFPNRTVEIRVVEPTKPVVPPIICDDPDVNGCVPNAETLAAFAEGDAIRRGEIPGHNFKSAEEFIAWLNSDEE